MGKVAFVHVVPWCVQWCDWVALVVVERHLVQSTMNSDIVFVSCFAIQPVDVLSD